MCEIVGKMWDGRNCERSTGGWQNIEELRGEGGRGKGLLGRDEVETGWKQTAK
jgi:hypothetical protein